jgi:glycosyltransferase involved in cell wall biosynthesis
MLTDLALHRAADGRQVHVISSRLSYEDPWVLYPACDTIQGVRVTRVASTRFGRAHLPGRALDYLSFYAAVFWCLLRQLRRGDVVVAKTDPPLLSVVAGLAAWVRGARLVNWLQDVFPEVGAALGVGVLAGFPGRCLRGLRDMSLRQAAANVVLGERMAAYVANRKVAPARIACIPNWANDVDIVPIAHPENSLRRHWGWGDRFVVAYSGNLGRAHEVQTLLAAMELLFLDERDGNIHFAFIGGGARMDEVRERVAARPGARVEFLPYQPRELLGASLGAADLHLVSLLPAMEGLIVPSKVYGIAAAGRPIAFVGDTEGEIGRLLARTSSGEAFAMGDAAGLARFIRRLAADPAAAGRMGENARRALDAQYSQARAFRAWRTLLDRLDS